MRWLRQSWGSSGPAREFVPIAVSTAARAVPNIGGSGWVRDLQEDSTLSPELTAATQAVQTAPTRAGYKTAVGQLLREWGNRSGYDSARENALAGG